MRKTICKGLRGMIGRRSSWGKSRMRLAPVGACRPMGNGEIGSDAT